MADAPLSSNPLLESVKMVADGTYGGYQWDLIADLGKEIERLTAERDEFEANLTIAERQVTEAQAERDHWHDEALRLSSAALAERAERDRLRAGVRRIALACQDRIPRYSLDGLSTSDFAFKLIAGAADETSG